MNKKNEIESKLDNQYIKAICYYSSAQAQRDSIMKIESIDIENVGGIAEFTLDKFDPYLNIICGENGVGKTNILDCIAYSFSRHSTLTLKKKYDSDCGIITAFVDAKNDEPKEMKSLIDEFSPRKKNSGRNYFSSSNEGEFLDTNEANLIYFTVNRFFTYEWIEHLQIYERKNDHLNNLDGVNNKGLKSWFIRSELLSNQDYTGDNDKKSVDLAKKAVNLLTQDYSFSALKQDMEIYINTPSGEIPYEYLSSGFKTCIFIIWGIIREIQIRFSDVFAGDFEGIILIDEIELHLHPEWQSKICSSLIKLFPKTQFIITTHSPHVVQSAEASQVIALSGENGYLKKRNLDIAPNGFKGWTIEEILTDVMGMPDTRTKWFRDNVELFEKALDEDDFISAKNAFDELESKLHPKSLDLSLFRYQFNSLKGRINDKD